MFKRLTAAIHQWLSSGQTVRDSRSAQGDEAFVARRSFFKRAAIGAVSVTGTAGLAKVVVDSVPQPDLQEVYKKEGLAGEQKLLQREYVLMSDQEKTDMVQTFVDNYSDRA